MQQNTGKQWNKKSMVTKWVNSILEKKMGQGIQEWNVQKLWKPLKNLKWSDITLHFLKAVFHKFHLGHCWIYWPKSCISKFSKHLTYFIPMFRRCSIKNVFIKFHKIYSKRQVLESLLNKAADQRPAALLKKDLDTGVSLWILRNF